MPQKFCHSLSLVRALFAESIPYQEHQEDNPLHCVKVTHCIKCLAFDLVLHKIEVNFLVHAFYRQVIADDRSKHRCIRRQTTYIQPSFMRLCPGRLPDSISLLLYNCHSSSPLVLVSYYIQPIVDMICTGLYPSISKLESSTVACAI